MDFEWDESKRLSVFRERGVDLVEAAGIFEGPVLTAPDKRHDYGERREVSIGMVNGVCLVVVHTERDGVRRLITAWRAGRKKYEHYQASIAGRHS